jgi:hypothetical protein
MGGGRLILDGNLTGRRQSPEPWDGRKNLAGWEAVKVRIAARSNHTLQPGFSQ